MYQFILSLHILVAVSLMGLILLQQGKGATTGAAFGSGASQTVFGSRGSGSFLLKLTTALAIIFFSTSILLNRITVKEVKTISQESVLPIPLTAPASVPATQHK